MPKLLLLSCFAFLLLFQSCSKDAGNPSDKRGSSLEIDIEGYDLFDANGVYVSHYGAKDKDWHFDDSLSANELKLFDFATPYDIKNTTPSIIRNNMLAYP